MQLRHIMQHQSCTFHPEPHPDKTMCTKYFCSQGEACDYGALLGSSSILMETTRFSVALHLWTNVHSNSCFSSCICSALCDASSLEMLIVREFALGDNFTVLQALRGFKFSCCIRRGPPSFSFILSQTHFMHDEKRSAILSWSLHVVYSYP